MHREEQHKMRTIGATISGEHIDLVVTEYENMIFVMITQNEKLGPMILVDKTTARNWEAERDAYFMNHLFGKEDEWSQSLARYLSDFTNPPKPVLYSILVKDDLKTNTEMIFNITQWTMLDLLSKSP
ncbi:hypothetical protein M8J77_007145 [Diaphorina citri]|nr:hypothetical protein M8J77_007145 [Diaphorina citri]